MKRKSDPTSLLKKANKSLHPKTPQYPAFQVGDTIRVHVKVIEGEKTRVQIYEGLVIAMKRGGSSASFVVRKISYGIGVERVFPFYSPVIDKITVVSKGEVRRAKLYYLRALSGRASRIKSEHIFSPDTGGPDGGSSSNKLGTSAADVESAGIAAKAVQA